jgi:hypothetical protein
MQFRPSSSPEGQRIFPSPPTFKREAAEQSRLAWVSFKSGRLRVLPVGGATSPWARHFPTMAFLDKVPGCSTLGSEHRLSIGKDFVCFR